MLFLVLSLAGLSVHGQILASLMVTTIDESYLS